MEKEEKLTSVFLVVLLPLTATVGTGCGVVLLLYGRKLPGFALLAIGAVLFSLLVWRHLKYVQRIKETAASAETAERFRAELAESHVAELEHYIGELERSSRMLRESRERFRHAATHDGLTGLANRNKFVELLGAKISNIDVSQHFAVLYLDLDRFKTVNDSLGHDVGDELIKKVAERLMQMASNGSMVGRFGGDEFAFLQENIATIEEAEAFADLVCRRLSEPFDLIGRQMFTSVSIGIAVADGRYTEPDELLRDADIAMYNAKETRRPYVVFDKIMHARAVSLLELETGLRHALARNEFELYYQPLVNLDDVGLMGFEALVRWNHPHKGLITPNEFISTAETTGLIIPMTTVLLRSACEQLFAWQKDGKVKPDLVVSVNLSPGYLAQAGVVDQIRTIVFESGIQPECLKLEITESAVMENAEAIVSVLRKIKDLGVRVSIDDFGTGYSNLSYLHRFPIDTLKIDRSFVGTMEQGSENGEIVRTVIALAKALKLSVIAEGVESIHQFHQLRVLGCEFGQGFLFSRPCPVHEIEKLLEDPSRWRNILPTIDHGAVARNREYTHMTVT